MAAPFYDDQVRGLTVWSWRYKAGKRWEKRRTHPVVEVWHGNLRYPRGRLMHRVTGPLRRTRALVWVWRNYDRIPPMPINYDLPRRNR